MVANPFRQQVLDLFNAKWPVQAPHHNVIQHRLIAAYDQFVADGLADPHFHKELLGENKERFEQRLGEIELAGRMHDAGFSLSSGGIGPDLLATRDGRKVWLELITPEPKDLPDEWIRPQNTVTTFPHEKILLRWTAAIKEKKGKGKDYLSRGIISPGDPYVIVVNDALLHARGGQLNGISQRPFAVEATLAVGPLQIQIDRATLETVSSGHMHRPYVINRNQAQVPADTFFDPDYGHVSAVMGTTLGMWNASQDHWESVIVHNPLSTAPVPLGLLPVEEEWACQIEPSQYTVYRVSKP